MASTLFSSCLSRSVCKHKSSPLPLAALGLPFLDPVLCLQVAPSGPTTFTGLQMLWDSPAFSINHFRLFACLAAVSEKGEGRVEAVPAGRPWV